MILSDLRCSEDFHDSQAAGVSHANWECKPVAENEKAQTLKKVGMFYNLWKTRQQLRVDRICRIVGCAVTMHTILIGWVKTILGSEFFLDLKVVKYAQFLYVLKTTSALLLFWISEIISKNLCVGNRPKKCWLLGKTGQSVSGPGFSEVVQRCLPAFPQGCLREGTCESPEETGGRKWEESISWKEQVFSKLVQYSLCLQCNDSRALFFSPLNRCKIEENLEVIRKDADLMENICTKTALDTLEDELPKSAIGQALIAQIPLEKEREMARKKEQERRRREAVSVCINVAVWDWFEQHSNVGSFS